MIFLIKMQGDIGEKIRAAKCIECKNSDVERKLGRIAVEMIIDKICFAPLVLKCLYTSP